MWWLWLDQLTWLTRNIQAFYDTPVFGLLCRHGAILGEELYINMDAVVFFFLRHRPAAALTASPESKQVLFIFIIFYFLQRVEVQVVSCPEHQNRRSATAAFYIKV